MTLYEILEVAKDATDEQIKKSCRKKAAKNHPDQNPGDNEATELYLKVSLAYEVLSDPIRRKDYDENGTTEKINELQKIAGVMVKAFLKALEEYEYPDKADMKKATLQILINQKSKVMSHIETLQIGLDRLRKCKDRFKVTDEKFEINYMQEFILVNIVKNEEEIKKIEREQIAMFDKAMEVLNSLEYDFDKDIRRQATMTFGPRLSYTPDPRSKLNPHDPKQIQFPAHDPEDSDIEDSDFYNKNTDLGEGESEE
jgi:hypothetical protein